MNKENVVLYRIEYYSAIKICHNVDGTGGHYFRQNKPETERHSFVGSEKLIS
jgi:hypothetical protein